MPTEISFDRHDRLRANDVCVDLALAEPEPIPFKWSLSFDPLIDFWERSVFNESSRNHGICFAELKAALAAAPELRGPVNDLALIERHHDLVCSLMSVIIPRASWPTGLVAILPPFDDRAVFATPAYEKRVPRGHSLPKANLDASTLRNLDMLRAYSMILRTCYDLSLEVDYPVIRTIQDPGSGLPFHFQAEIDTQFLKVGRLGEPVELTPDQRKRLNANSTNLQVLLELIPPERFEFRGFMVVRVLDVTDQSVLSEIKRDLLERGTIVCHDKFLDLQSKLRTLFRRPKLTISLAAIRGQDVLLLNAGETIARDCIFYGSQRFPRSRFKDSLFERAVAEKRTLVVEDLKEEAHPSEIEKDSLRHGKRNLAVAPLVYKDDVIGTLHLASPDPGDINLINSMKLREVVPLFAAGIKRSLDDLESQVESVIKKHCTAIHPAVEWRFRRAALEFLSYRDEAAFSGMPDIVFRDVYPLYGASDIRDSSKLRSDAIKKDLMAQLQQTDRIVQLAYERRPLPYLDQLSFKIRKLVDTIQNGVLGEDELLIKDFLLHYLHPALHQISAWNKELRSEIHRYFASVDPKLGLFYRRRKQFEQSVAALNELISSILDDEQERAQAMFPHYFEKHASDGLEYNIYLGGSLVDDRKFDPMYLRNLRLWQLLLTCRIVRQTHDMLPKLAVLPLESAHLIAVQDVPTAIRFRYEERKFDVDGVYNIRYEIMKKRIDKATVKGRSERLTQPRKIAIVYSHGREAREYEEYLEYLQNAGYLLPGLERLDLAEVQGIQGLKAFRVEVNLHPVEAVANPLELFQPPRALPRAEPEPVLDTG